MQQGCRGVSFAGVVGLHFIALDLCSNPSLALEGSVNDCSQINTVFVCSTLPPKAKTFSVITV